MNTSDAGKITEYYTNFQMLNILIDLFNLFAYFSNEFVF